MRSGDDEALIGGDAVGRSLAEAPNADRTACVACEGATYSTWLCDGEGYVVAVADT